VYRVIPAATLYRLGPQYFCFEAAVIRGFAGTREVDLHSIEVGPLVKRTSGAQETCDRAMPR
jgi:hypothetical protein